MPFGSPEKAFENSSTLGFLSSTQALADYAQLIIDLKKNLSAQNCPVIALGGSYGGMLASWFRLKYPHITIGALASSAPILYFDNITPQNGYDVIVTKDFRETSESCYNTIRQSWSEIDRVAAEYFKAFNSSQQLKDYLTLLYESAAQYGNPPDDLIGSLCNIIDGAPKGAAVLGRIAAAANAGIVLPCHLAYDYLYNQRSSGWAWQTCTEMVMPIGYGANETMFQYSPFDLNNFTKSCQELFGVTPRPHWITTEFGGHDISSTIVALHSNKGAHCLDIISPTPNEPDWLIAQRERSRSLNLGLQSTRPD
ncbi:Peptidase S [Trema orientale]|uniref:Peptidase S n=1 Tax=Trema orientale TaxID=63057 RepID=A0A2P5DD29_TREOI|nr:Peptidase S [Trema orientale]